MGKIISKTVIVEVCMLKPFTGGVLVPMYYYLKNIIYIGFELERFFCNRKQGR